MSDVAAESVMWLAHRLGPVLTSRHLAKNLLRMLAVCYSDPEALKVRITVFTVNTVLT